MPITPIAGLFEIALSVSALLGHKSVKAEIIISSEPEVVWQVLTDLESYPQWNPVFVVLDGEFKQGGKVSYQVTEAENKSATISASVNKIVPNKLINQSGGLWGVITFDHTYTLTEVEQGTKVTIYEEYTGAYVHFWDESQIAEQYKKLAQALKTRVNELN
ncbi:SRPBCC domain-containing protein [Endozoicomonas sp. G2_1]|uniref:SRPBCC domain-containing protein n=1 Tax=Endozoicomonas sp. G2_1 TaxID=2821091 RepID=UPI001AD9DC41|nr:SRPBCC domain-containing protein [Endozoicomonas sp. G2_1]MBO9488884.1 SRPBCC domain-containing protein [Endozoicomonas sp. G2_1]